MSADLNTTIQMQGTTEELLAMVNVLKKFETENSEQYRTQHDCAYLDFVSIIIGKKEYRISKLTDEKLYQIISKAKNGIVVDALGPWGIYEEPKEVCLFERLADVVPNATFKGTISGFITGAKIKHKAELKKSKLHLSNLCLLDNVFEDEYIKYLKTNFSFEDFCEVFNFNSAMLNERCYTNFIFALKFNDTIMKFNYLFFSNINNLPMITKNEWQEAANKIMCKGIIDFKQFKKTINKKDFVEKYIYDPMSKVNC